MGRNRGESTMGALRAIYREGGGGLSGIGAFWAGTGPKVHNNQHACPGLPPSGFLSLQVHAEDTGINHAIVPRPQMVESASKGSDPHVFKGGHPEGAKYR